MNRAVAECRLPDLFRPLLTFFVNVSWSKSGNTPALYCVVVEDDDVSIDDDNDTVILPKSLLSIFCRFMPELFLIHCIDVVLFKFCCLAVTF